MNNEDRDTRVELLPKSPHGDLPRKTTHGDVPNAEECRTLAYRLRRPHSQYVADVAADALEALAEKLRAEGASPAPHQDTAKLYRCHCGFTVTAAFIDRLRVRGVHRNAVGKVTTNDGCAYCPICDDETLVEVDVAPPAPPAETPELLDWLAAESAVRVKNGERYALGFDRIGTAADAHADGAYGVIKRMRQRLQTQLAEAASSLPRWQDISTAPVEGRFLICDRMRRMMVADGHMYSLSVLPGVPKHLSGHHWTHWMPLPAPPQETP